MNVFFFHVLLGKEIEVDLLVNNFVFDMLILLILTLENVDDESVVQFKEIHEHLKRFDVISFSSDGNRCHPSGPERCLHSFGLRHNPPDDIVPFIVILLQLFQVVDVAQDRFYRAKVIPIRQPMQARVECIWMFEVISKLVV